MVYLQQRRCCWTALLILSWFSLAHAAVLRARDAYTSSLDKTRKDGERHDPVPPPEGSKLISFPLNDKVQLPVYWTEHPDNAHSTHAIIIIHGSKRDGDSYWGALNGIAQQQMAWKNSNVDPKLIILAPEFYSKKLNEGLYQPNQLAWADPNVWQAGEASNFPKDSKISSFAAIQSLIEHFDDRKRYPNMKNITLMGHSGGAQFVSRYSMVVHYKPKHLHVRYLIADPSSAAYFTPDRPITDPSYLDFQDCPLFNDWRYGFHHFDLPPYSGKSAQAYYRTYVSRDVVHLNGLLDTELNGDQQCMAVLQGGSQRIARNLAWWKYINLLAGTEEDVSFFPGDLPHVPNWHDVSKGRFNVRMSIAPNASHDVEEVFASPQGISAIFEDVDLDIGWRPTEPFPIPEPNSTEPLAGGNGTVFDSGSAFFSTDACAGRLPTIAALAAATILVVIGL